MEKSFKLKIQIVFRKTICYGEDTEGKLLGLDLPFPPSVHGTRLDVFLFFLIIVLLIYRKRYSLIRKN